MLAYVLVFMFGVWFGAMSLAFACALFAAPNFVADDAEEPVE